MILLKEEQSDQGLHQVLRHACPNSYDFYGTG